MCPRRLWFVGLLAVMTVLALPSPASAVPAFADGFENAASVSELLRPDRWSYVQRTHQGSDIRLSTEHVHSGAQAIRFFGPASAHSPTLTKADIGKNGITFLLGQTVEVDAWFYFESAPDLNDIFLIDAECGGCGVQSPGARVMLAHGHPVVERGELGPFNTITQNEVRVPLQRWFRLTYRLKLGLGPLGHVKLWVDGLKVIDRAGTTVFAGGGFVDNFQVGLTANPSTGDAVLFVDDVTINRIA
ncbi:MAG: hypothetical protein ABR518_07890 [Actinomycetota bacterium]